MAFDIDPSLLGREFDRSEHEPVQAEKLIAFARALGETHPCYVEDGPELVAHPTWVVTYRGHKMFPDDMPAFFRGQMSFDAGKDVDLGAPIRPGDRITIVSTIHDVYEKTGRSGGMVFVVLRLTLTNQRQELVAHVDNRFLYKVEASA